MLRTCVCSDVAGSSVLHLSLNLMGCVLTGQGMGQRGDLGRYKEGQANLFSAFCVQLPNFSEIEKPVLQP